MNVPKKRTDARKFGWSEYERSYLYSARDSGLVSEQMLVPDLRLVFSQ